MNVSISIMDEQDGVVYIDVEGVSAADVATELQSLFDANGVLWS